MISICVQDECIPWIWLDKLPASHTSMTICCCTPRRCIFWYCIPRHINLEAIATEISCTYLQVHWQHCGTHQVLRRISHDILSSSCFPRNLSILFFSHIALFLKFLLLIYYFIAYSTSSVFIATLFVSNTNSIACPLQCDIPYWIYFISSCLAEVGKTGGFLQVFLHRRQGQQMLHSQMSLACFIVR